jgi:predicted metal-binding protein
MMEENERIRLLEAKTLQLGAFRAKVIGASAVETDASFRTLCESNACGLYGKCWTCPPDIGQIDVLMAQLRTYSHVLVYQTVGQLEDSFDFENMIRAGNAHNVLAQSLRSVFKESGIQTVLHLGAGGCRVCGVCAKRTGEPCRHPDLAMSSLEAYGINVSRLAPAADMKYINGNNTVTYFGAVFFRF